jgi:prevent-host-death family protein
MDSIIPISDLQTKAKRYVEQVKDTSEPVIITQRGRAAAVLISYAEFEGLKATQDEMSFADWQERLARAEAESAAGKGIELSAYIKSRKRNAP